jgi:hypothetical protein
MTWVGFITGGLGDGNTGLGDGGAIVGGGVSANVVGGGDSVMGIVGMISVGTGRDDIVGIAVLGSSTNTIGVIVWAGERDGCIEGSKGGLKRSSSISIKFRGRMLIGGVASTGGSSTTGIVGASTLSK